MAAAEEEEKALRDELELLNKDFALRSKVVWSGNSQERRNSIAIVSPDRFFEANKENKITLPRLETCVSRFKETRRDQHTKELKIIVSPDSLEQIETYGVLAARLKERLILSLSSLD